MSVLGAEDGNDGMKDIEEKALLDSTDNGWLKLSSILSWSIGKDQRPLLIGDK
jgi:hypothetical protein